jgi:hypothetical protein
MREWIQVARRPTVVRRALKYALVVGAILVTINHGEAIVRGDVSLGRLLRIVLTVSVPYMVSTASSVSALRDREREDAARPAARASRT